MAIDTDQLVAVCDRFLGYFDESGALKNISPSLFEAGNDLKAVLKHTVPAGRTELADLKQSIIRELQETLRFDVGKQYGVVAKVERLRSSLGSNKFYLRNLGSPVSDAALLRGDAPTAAPAGKQFEEMLSEPVGKFALCLSGGGFRATLFHLGVINAVAAAGKLQDVEVLVGVSGGAITGAHLVKNWAAYVDDPQTPTLELVKYCRRGIRTQLILKWVASWPLRVFLRPLRLNFLSRCYFLTKAYHGLFGDFKNGDIAAPVRLHLAASSMTTGVPVSFGPNAFHYGRDVEKSDATTHLPNQSIPNESLKLKLGVACSSAFPALFPPYKINRFSLTVAAKDWPLTHYMTDGGVYDNFGLDTIDAFEQDVWTGSIPIIASNAGAHSDIKVDKAFGTLFTRGPRVADLLMERARHLQGDRYRVTIEKQLTWMQLSNTQTGKILDVGDDIIRSLSMMRTDLNSFSAAELDALYAHGYAIGADALNQRFHQDFNCVPQWLPCGTELSKLQIEDFQDSAERNPGLCIALAAAIFLAEWSVILWLAWRVCSWVRSVV